MQSEKKTGNKSKGKSHKKSKMETQPKTQIEPQPETQIETKTEVTIETTSQVPVVEDNTIIISGETLTIEDVVNVARNEYLVAITDSALEKCRQSAEMVTKLADSNKVVYGVTTGFGSLSDQVIDGQEASRLSRNILVSHAVGLGESLPKDWVRAAILVRINALIKGHSGVKVETINALLNLLNYRITPQVPRLGSLACSGDLCLLSHVGICISDPIDENDLADNPVELFGSIMPSTRAFHLLDLKKVKLGPKEGLALTNGSTFCAGIGCLLYNDLEIFSKTCVGGLAMCLEALCGRSQAFDARIHELRNNDSQMDVARWVRNMVEGSTLIDSRSQVQDAYSLRCGPQVDAILLESLKMAKERLLNEINAVTDNPILFGSEALSGGNFHGGLLGHMVESLKIAVSNSMSIANARISRLIDPKQSNGLPPMLVKDAGLRSGYMIAQYTATALTKQGLYMASPDSIYTIPTCAGQEDHNSNAWNATLHLSEMLECARDLIAIEYLLATRGLTFRLEEDRKLGTWTGSIYQAILSAIGTDERDHLIPPEIRKVRQLLHSSEFITKLNLLSEQTEKQTGKQRQLGTARGTKDYHPEEVLFRREVMDKIEAVFEQHGAVPIDTPIFEKKDILFGKYGDANKLVFELLDQGGTPLCLRYDLTVPLARYIAQHGLSSLKRYHTGKVYRRDNPSIQKGRFREFYQMDFDIVGTFDNMVTDADAIKVVCSILEKLDLGFVMKFNHKGLLDFLLNLCGVQESQLKTVCSSIDKLDKTHWKQIRQELLDKGQNLEVVEKIGETIQLQGHPEEVLQTLKSKYSQAEVQDTFNDLTLLFKYLRAMKCLDKLCFDLSLARGLDYYTGVIFECVLTEKEFKVGSVAGGGRYDNLVGMFKDKPIPAVGGSIGIERLFTVLEQKKKNLRRSPTQVYVTLVAPKATPEITQDLLLQVMEICEDLWKVGVCAEFNNSASKRAPMKEQIAATLGKGIPYMILLGETEVQKGIVMVKDLAKTQQTEVPRDQIGQWFRKELSISQ